MSVIYVLWLRQMKRYLRARMRIVASLAQPLLFLLALGFGFGPTFEKAGNGSYIQFLAPGIVAMAILFSGMFSGIEILFDRQFGFLKETLVAPVPRLYIVTGRTLGAATVAMTQGVIVLLFCLVAGFRMENVALLPVAVVFMFLIAAFFTAVGTVFGSVIQDMQAFPLVMNFISLPLFFFSGALFPLHGLPRFLRIAMRLNPLTYGVDGLRGALAHPFNFGSGVDFLVMSIASAALLSAGTYLFSKIQI